MTISSAIARPYSVFVEVPQFHGGLFALQDSETYIDRDVTPGQLDAFSTNDNRIKTILACLATSIFLGLFPMAFGMISVLDALVEHNLIQLSWVLGLILAWVLTIVVSHKYISRRQKSYDETTAALAQRLVPVPRDDRRGDLRRIQTALTTIQSGHGTAYDDRAREAVAAVLDQNLHRPHKKHLIIADSAARDSDSVAIRTRALAAKASWSGDVAKAEHLVLELEDAAAGKAPAKV
ncbi:hypothetical protein IV500_05810 [Paeniglutamicibacter antarcticus]|uniref:Uncharacterized protein n=1 Tax=Arthrobacter terrae TaxID=2935737 RepID=A0A931CSI1_9MICC|nr:hypothetical protein [Arthrobacter terrae]MBG0738938.1 hypothetical protein [Arthrobacter terrae]